VCSVSFFAWICRVYRWEALQFTLPCGPPMRHSMNYLVIAAWRDVSHLENPMMQSMTLTGAVMLAAALCRRRTRAQGQDSAVRAPRVRG
jgi:hypothetical protein